MGIDHTIKKEAAAVVTQTNKVCIFAAPLCVAWSLTMCLVLALSHIKSPQPEVSEYAWALCYPPSRLASSEPYVPHLCRDLCMYSTRTRTIYQGQARFHGQDRFRARVQSTLTVHHAITGGRRARRRLLWRSR